MSARILYSLIIINMLASFCRLHLKQLFNFYIRKIKRFSTTKRAYLIYFSLICNLYYGKTYAQNEVMFSNTFALPTIVNPGAAGRSGLIDATAGFRQQWVGFDDAPSTFFLTADVELKFLKNFHGVSVAALQDKEGSAFKKLNLFAAYSYHIYLDKGLLGIGARFGVFNVETEVSSLSTSVTNITDDYHQASDDALTDADDSQSAFDVGVGAFYQNNVSYLSLSALHLTAPDIELGNNGSRYKIRPTVHFAAGRLLGRDLKVRSLEPRFALRSDFASLQLDMSLNVNIRQSFWFGLGCRPQDAMIFALGVKLKNGLDLTYSYDLSLSKLKRYNSGSHEIVARYSIDFDRVKPTKRYKSVRIL